jgi:predicted transcriptional regulator
MKTTVWIPDALFGKVERLTWGGRRSRSEVYAAALAEYVVRHSPDDVTATDRLCAGVDDKTDAFTTAATRRTLEKSEW